MNKFLYPICIFVFLFFPLFGSAQFTDDFTDGNFTLNPTWTGDDSLFKVNASLQLQSAAHAGSSGEMHLANNISLLDEMEWRFWVRMVFNPSTQNFARIYLSSDQQNTEGNLNGYYVQLGGSTGNTDSISLYKQIGPNRMCLIKGRPGTLGKSINQARIKVNRNKQGQWFLFSDTTGNDAFISEGIFTDTAELNGNYLGVDFRYTSSNVGNFFVDEIYAGVPVIDLIPPKVLRVIADDSSSMKIVFNEKILLPTSAEVIVQGGLQAIGMQLNGNDLNLNFANKIPEDVSIEIQLKKIKDLSSNLLDTVFSFIYHVVKPGDILITEIMADPDPPQGLPIAEYIEIYNSTSIPIPLIDLQLGDASAAVPIPNSVIEPGGFVIMCDPKDSFQLGSSGKVIAISSFPSLNNSGDLLYIQDKNLVRIHELSYDLSWYQNTIKSAGGWSMEMINPAQTCKGNSNWSASVNGKGGTPGCLNSKWLNLADTTAPELLRINIEGAKSIRLLFNETLKPDLSLIRIYLNHMAAGNILFDPNTANELIVVLPDSLHHLNNYELTLDSIADCSGNSKHQTCSFTFFETSAAKQNDVLITEVYFDLNKKGNFPNAEFLELYNRSEFAIELNRFQLSDEVSSTRFPAYVLKPGEYLIVCQKNNAYLFESMGSTLGLDFLPSLSNSDKLTLRDSFGFVIHQVDYKQEWLIKTAKIFSCSLEMIDKNNPCGKSENWHASIDPGGATPGRQNSVYGKVPDNTAPHLKRIYVTNPTEMILTFSEDIDSLSFGTPNNIKLNGKECLEYYNYSNNQLNKISLNLKEELDSIQTFELKISQIGDCANRQGSDLSSLPFQLPEQAQPGNIVINEILFNPNTGQNDFLELYNTTSRTLDLKGLFLQRTNETGEREDAIPLGTAGWMAMPEEYLVVTLDQTLLGAQYHVTNAESILEQNLPTLNDDEGYVLLINQKDEVLDSVYYSDKMHLSFLNKTEGVSLEKINPFLSGADANNWTSAAEDNGFATPTNKNSQYRTAVQSGAFTTALPYFSPDGDGQNDIMTFTYTCKTEKNVADLLIYNQNGELVKELCKSKLLGAKGEVNWNGEDASGRKAGIGMYLVLWKVYTGAGEAESSKLSIALLGR